ncbi:MAG TPA: hypothetical protein DCS87_11230 [Rheinheimera sp.]|nr:hypothetical protein [Rheinheimera sp.]
MLRRARPWLISLLVHALLFAGMWQLRTTAPTKQPAPIEVSLWQASAPTKPIIKSEMATPNEPASAKEQTSATHTSSTPSVTSTAAVPKKAMTKPAMTKQVRDTSAHQVNTPAAQKPTSATSVVTTASKDSITLSTTTLPQPNRGSLFDRATDYLQTQQQRELSKSELQAVSTRSALEQPRSIAQQHQAALTASGMASNVQDVLDDGRQVVKIGQSCFLASANTDLLKDPLSAKSVACERKASTADQLNQLLESRRNRGFTQNEPTGR